MIRNQRITVYTIPNFGSSVIRKKNDNAHVELVEHINDKNKALSGAYMLIDVYDKSFNACFYNENNIFGPSLFLGEKKLEYSFSSGANPYVGFRIIYENNSYYIGYYDYSGNFTGKGLVIYEDGRVFYVKSTKFGDISKVNLITKKFPKINTTVRIYPQLQELYTNNQEPIIYTWKDPKYIHGQGLMYCQNFIDDMGLSDISELNKSSVKRGYGFYPYNEKSFFLGNVSRFRINGTQRLGFCGPCIYKNNDYYELGVFNEDVKDGITLSADFQRSFYELTDYDKGKRHGISFGFTIEEGLAICVYKKDNLEPIYLKVHNDLSVSLYQNSRYLQGFSYPFDIDNDEIEEVTVDNDELQYNKLIEKLEGKIAVDYRDFKYDVEYNKEIINKKHKVTPCVTIKKYLGRSEVVTIPEHTVKIEENAFEEHALKLKTLIIETKNMIAIENNIFRECENLSSLRFEKDTSIRSIGIAAFYNNKLKHIVFPQYMQNIGAISFIYCEKLISVSVPYFCKIADNAFPETCAIIYEGAFTKNDIKIQEEKNKEAKKTLKENKKYHQDILKDEEFDRRVEEAQKKAQKKKKNENQIKEKEKEKTYKEKKIPKERNSEISESIKEFLSDNIFSPIMSAIAILFGIILFIPKCILKLFTKIAENDISTLLCVISLIIGIVILILGFAGCLQPIHDSLTYFVNESVPSLFGFRLTRAYTGLFNHVRLDMQSTILTIILALLYVIVAPFNLLLNIGVLILVVICYILYIVLGVSLIYGLGAVLCLPPLITLLKSGKRGFALVVLLAAIAMTIVYYLMFSTFYVV